MDVNDNQVKEFLINYTHDDPSGAVCFVRDVLEEARIAVATEGMNLNNCRFYFVARGDNEWKWSDGCAAEPADVYQEGEEASRTKRAKRSHKWRLALKEKHIESENVLELVAHVSDEELECESSLSNPESSVVDKGMVVEGHSKEVPVSVTIEKRVEVTMVEPRRVLVKEAEGINYTLIIQYW
ncbi:hypothetical protein EC973_006167 [Apophysomyces ossiformis]|uniref:Uncharacterized protein n=1 Tax=Apophysomyces ossiformis TaxID=679940 RepID=A0A8H7EL16_9FUNG|nr:hypothetical protein EC973_006167 [Apophysomyces ossiformis]